MRSCIVIPARMQSRRFPGKPMAMVHGKPLLHWTYDQAMKTGANRVCVASPDMDVLNYCHKHDIRVWRIAAECHCGTARVAAVMERRCESFDVWVNWQVDEPLVNPKDVDRLIRLTLCDDIGTLHQHPDASFWGSHHRVKARVSSCDGRILDFTRYNLPGAYEHVGLYTFRPGVLECVAQMRSQLSELEALEQLAWLDGNFQIFTVQTSGSISVNIPEDIPILEKHMAGVS